MTCKLDLLNAWKKRCMQLSKDGDLGSDSCAPLNRMHAITTGSPSLLDNSLCSENDALDLCEPTVEISNLWIHC
jgi:hypothetical protein